MSPNVPGGYISVDFGSVSLSSTPATISGLYSRLTAARSTNKPILFSGIREGSGSAFKPSFLYYYFTSNTFHIFVHQVATPASAANATAASLRVDEVTVSNEDAVTLIKTTLTSA